MSDNRERPKIGDIAIFLAGAKASVLRVWDVDRAYYVGLGMSVLFTAIVSTASLTSASVIALHFHGAKVYVVAATYFMLILALDRWLVSDPITGFVRPRSGILAVVAWLGHLIIEVLKISVRVAIAVLSAWLFASFLLLVVYNHEIQNQLKGVATQGDARYQMQLQGLTDQLSADAKQTITTAQGKVQQLQDNYKQGQQAISDAQKVEQTGLATAHAKGIYCTQVPVYSWVTNRVTGGVYRVQTGSATECPQEIQDIENAYSEAVSHYPETYDQLQTDIHNVLNAPDVLQAQQTVQNAPANAAAQLGAEKPTDTDGLAARMHALGLIVHKPSGTCPTPPALKDIAYNDACIAQYSADVASMQTNLRYWLFAVEIAPVVFKLLHSLLPRRGYAWQMRAKDYKAEVDAETKMEIARIEKRKKLAKLLRLERVNLELETTLEEQQLREVARASYALGLRQIRGRLAKAISRAPELERKDADATSDVLEVVYDPNVQGFESEPTVRIIDDDRHLYQ